MTVTERTAETTGEYAPSEAAAEALAPATSLSSVDARADAGQRLARVVSDVCSPPVLTLPILAIAAYSAGPGNAWRYVLLYAVVAVLIPFLDLLWQLHTGQVSDMHLPARHERTRPFVVGTLAATVGLFLLVILSAPPLIVGLAVVVVVQTLVLFGITLRWQVSVHGATVASLATIGTLLMGPVAALLVFLVPVVAWARLRLDRHTPAQIVVGVAIGGMIPILVLGGWLGYV